MAASPTRSGKRPAPPSASSASTSGSTSRDPLPHLAPSARPIISGRWFPGDENTALVCLQDATADGVIVGWLHRAHQRCQDPTLTHALLTAVAFENTRRGLDAEQALAGLLRQRYWLMFNDPPPE